jgi:hypothetical protein
MYTDNLDMSIITEIITPVAINSSFVKFSFIKNADLSAPWLPESPPKKPLRIPPIGKYFLSKFILVKNGIISNNAKNAYKTAINNLTGIITNSEPNAE